jgi:hypothetical protein
MRAQLAYMRLYISSDVPFEIGALEDLLCVGTAPIAVEVFL